MGLQHPNGVVQCSLVVRYDGMVPGYGLSLPYHQLSHTKSQPRPPTKTTATLQLHAAIPEVFPLLQSLPAPETPPCPSIPRGRSATNQVRPMMRQGAVCVPGEWEVAAGPLLCPACCDRRPDPHPPLMGLPLRPNTVHSRHKSAICACYCCRGRCGQPGRGQCTACNCGGWAT